MEKYDMLINYVRISRECAFSNDKFPTATASSARDLYARFSSEERSHLQSSDALILTIR